MTSNGFGVVANIINTNTTILQSNQDSSTNAAGGSVSTSITGIRSDYAVTTQHLGEAAGTTVLNSSGFSANFAMHSKTTYLSGGNSFIGQATDSGFGQTIKFKVSSATQFKANLSGIITTAHRAYQPSGPMGSFFLIFRLYGSGVGYLFNSEVQNSGALSNVPFSQMVSLMPGVDYELTLNAACNAGTVNYASNEAGPGAYGETAFNGAYSLQAVPEPATAAFLVVALGAMALRRRS